jgi:hypothetical protein
MPTLSYEDLERLLLERTENVRYYVAMLGVLVPALEQIRDANDKTVSELREIAGKALVNMDHAVMHAIPASFWADLEKNL